jgi:hypothetical protein
MDVAHAVTRRWLAAALAAPLACGHGSAGHTPIPGKPMSPLDVKLIVEPATFALADRPRVKVGFEVTNRSASFIDPRPWDAVLLVNGKRALVWDLAVQNGAYDSTWTHLPPNQTLSRWWPLAEALFEKPGDYHLVLQHAGARLTLDVRVTP